MKIKVSATVNIQQINVSKSQDPEMECKWVIRRVGRVRGRCDYLDIHIDDKAGGRVITAA